MKRIRYDYTFGIPVKVNIVEIKSLMWLWSELLVNVRGEIADIERSWWLVALVGLNARLLSRGVGELTKGEGRNTGEAALFGLVIIRNKCHVKWLSEFLRLSDLFLPTRRYIAYFLDSLAMILHRCLALVDHVGDSSHAPATFLIMISLTCIVEVGHDFLNQSGFNRVCCCNQF